MGHTTATLVALAAAAYIIAESLVLPRTVRSATVAGPAIVGLVTASVLSLAISGTLRAIPLSLTAGAAVFAVQLFRNAARERSWWAYLINVVTTMSIASAIAVVGIRLLKLSVLPLDFFGSAFHDVIVGGAGLLATVFVGGEIVGRAIQPFSDQIAKDAGRDGFVRGGRVIGQLERTLIFIFAVTGQIAAIGFLVAAKSVFRFGEIKDHEHRMEAEYIIIGTLMSFVYGILASYLTRHLVFA